MLPPSRTPPIFPPSTLPPHPPPATDSTLPKTFAGVRGGARPAWRRPPTIPARPSLPRTPLLPAFWAAASASPVPPPSSLPPSTTLTKKTIAHPPACRKKRGAPLGRRRLTFWPAGRLPCCARARARAPRAPFLHPPPLFSFQILPFHIVFCFFFQDAAPLARAHTLYTRRSRPPCLPAVTLVLSLVLFLLCLNQTPAPRLGFLSPQPHPLRPPPPGSLSYLESTCCACARAHVYPPTPPCCPPREPAASPPPRLSAARGRDGNNGVPSPPHHQQQRQQNPPAQRETLPLLAQRSGQQLGRVCSSSSTDETLR